MPEDLIPEDYAMRGTGDAQMHAYQEFTERLLVQPKAWLVTGLRGLLAPTSWKRCLA
jgi:hypothetical protein